MSLELPTQGKVASSHQLVNEFFSYFLQWLWHLLPWNVRFSIYNLPLSKSPGSVHIFFTYLRGLLFVALYQHIIMVKAPSSSKSTFDCLKIGPPTKKSTAISIAKAKITKQQSIKKYVRTGEYFFCWVVSHLMLMLNSNRQDANTPQKGPKIHKCFFFPRLFFSCSHKQVKICMLIIFLK